MITGVKKVLNHLSSANLHMTHGFVEDNRKSMESDVEILCITNELSDLTGISNMAAII